MKSYTKDSSGKMHRKGYEVVETTKTAQGKRMLILTPQAKAYIQMALDKNKERGFAESPYIFLDKSGQRIHDHAVNNILRRLNGKRDKRDNFVIQGKPSGNHAIRKTCISELHDSQKLPDEVLKDFAGHKDIATTRACYIHPTKSVSDYADVFVEVFDGKEECN